MEKRYKVYMIPKLRWILRDLFNERNFDRKILENLLVEEFKFVKYINLNEKAIHRIEESFITNTLELKKENFKAKICIIIKNIYKNIKMTQYERDVIYDLLEEIINDDSVYFQIKY